MSDPARNQFKRQLAPGIWEDMNGNPHFSLPELLALVGLEDTPEHRAKLAAKIRATIAEANPAKVRERATWND